ERQAIALVVVLPLLILHRRPEPDLSARGPDEVDAESMTRAVGQRVDEAVDERALRRCELRVLAADRIDGEGLAAEHARYLVGVEPRGIDHDPGEDRLALGGEHHAVGVAI